MTSSRQWEIDALRGLMLVLMTVTHLPTRLTSPLGQPFGFVSAAEGFVLLSAYMAGLVYTRLAYRSGIDEMRKAFWRRALKIYACQAATLLFLFTVIAALGMKVDQPAVKNLMSFYLHSPHEAFAAGLLLIYQPPLLDILPLYILFMLASPWVLAWAMRNGWSAVLWTSLGFWVAAQFGLGSWLYEAGAHLTGTTVPLRETGSFVTFAWQFLWAVGLWAGASRVAPNARPFAFPKGIVHAATGMALICLVWRHVEGQTAFRQHEMLNMLFDKWALGPLRLLDLAALAVVALVYGPWLASRIPRPRWLETMGSASLPVFCAHLLIVLTVLALFGSNPLERPVWLDVALLVVSFGLLYAVALLTQWFDRKSSGGAPTSRPGKPPLKAVQPPIARVGQVKPVLPK